MKCPNKRPIEVKSVILEFAKTTRKRMLGDFSDVFKTITADNGSEFLDSEAIKKAAKCEEVYYAHPYSSWEHGSNEVANKLIRRFVPKGTKIEKLNAKDIKRIENWMSNYPRRLFGYKTANQIFAA